MLSGLRQCCQQKISLTLLPASLRPIFRAFCLDAIGVLGRYRREEVDANGVSQS